MKKENLQKDNHYDTVFIDPEFETLVNDMEIYKIIKKEKGEECDE